MKWSEDSELLNKIDNLIIQQNNNLSLERKKIKQQKEEFKKNKLYSYEKNKDVISELNQKQLKPCSIIKSQLKKIKIEKKKIIKYQIKKGNTHIKMLKNIEKSGVDLVKQIKIEKKYGLKINELSSKIAKCAILINGISDLAIVYAENKI